MKCVLCGGTGKRERPSFVDPSKSVEANCHYCNGRGEIETEEERTQKRIKADRDRIIDSCRAFYRKPDGQDFPIHLIATIVHEGGAVCSRCFRSAHEGECR